VGVLLVILAVVAAFIAIIPAAWPWQWNRSQQERRIIRS